MRKFAKALLCCILCLTLLPLYAQADAKSLKNGSQGASVKKLQERLQYFGLFTGQVDGVYGDMTAASVSEAQRLLTELGGYTFPAVGQADEETLALLYSDDEEIQAMLFTLCPGSRGERVKTLQNRLIDLGMLSGYADGAYGNATKAAVTDFQNYALQIELTTLPATGNADPYTVQLINSDLSDYGFKAPVFFDETKPLSLCEEYLYSRGCILIDGPSGEILFEMNAHTPMYPASTTKVLTLLTSLEYGNTEEKYTVPDAAAEVPQDSSLVPVNPGEKMRKIDLLYGLIIRSGNDAANALAVIDAGSVEAFVQRMNEKARELGMYESNFVNPHGYHDENHYTTAYDLSLAARAGLSDPDFCRIVTCLEYTMPATKKRDALPIYNTYEIFDPESPYYIPYAAGVKSGFTSVAGFCFVGAAQKDGRTLIAVILGAPSRNAEWTDLRRLYEYGFALEP